MSAIAFAVPGPFEPDRCVPRVQAPSCPPLVPTVLVIVIVAVWAAVVAVGIPPYAATASLASAAGLGLRIAARLQAAGPANA